MLCFFSVSQSTQPPLTFFLSSSVCMCVCICKVCVFSLHSTKLRLAGEICWREKNGWAGRAGRAEQRDSADSGTRPHCSTRLVTLHLPASSQTAHWPTTSAGAKGTAVLNSTKKILSLPPLVPQWENSAANITVDTGPFRLQYLCCISTSWREVFWW